MSVKFVPSAIKSSKEEILLVFKAIKGITSSKEEKLYGVAVIAKVMGHVPHANSFVRFLVKCKTWYV